jgi:hypothetical protein
MCRALGKSGVRESSKSLLTSQLSPVWRKAKAGCISSPVRSSEKLRSDLPEVRRQGQEHGAGEPVLRHEIGIECAHRPTARIPREDERNANR